MLKTEPTLEFSPEYPEQAYILNYVHPESSEPVLQTDLALSLEWARQQVLATLPPAPALDDTLAEAVAEIITRSELQEEYSLRIQALRSQYRDDPDTLENEVRALDAEYAELRRLPGCRDLSDAEQQAVFANILALAVNRHIEHTLSQLTAPSTLG